MTQITITQETTIDRVQVLTDTCWQCDTACSVFSEYQDDGRVFCSLDCLNEVAQ